MDRQTVWRGLLCSTCVLPRAAPAPASSVVVVCRGGGCSGSSQLCRGRQLCCSIPPFHKAPIGVAVVAWMEIICGLNTNKWVRAFLSLYPEVPAQKHGPW